MFVNMRCRIHSLYTLQRRRTNFAEVWAASFFFSPSGALSLVSLHTLSLPAYLYNQVLASLRKKRTAVQHPPNQSNTKNPHKTQLPQRKGKQARQSHQAPHAHAHNNQAHNQTSPHASPRDHPKTNHTTLQFSTMTKDFKKASTERHNPHIFF